MYPPSIQLRDELELADKSRTPDSLRVPPSNASMESQVTVLASLPAVTQLKWNWEMCCAGQTGIHFTYSNGELQKSYFQGGGGELSALCRLVGFWDPTDPR